MTKLFLQTFLVLFLTVSLAAQDYDSAKLTNQLRTQIETQSMATHRIFILLEEQLDFARWKQQFTNENIGLDERARTVITQLQENATESQRDLLAFLTQSEQVDPASIRSFWVSNLIFTEVTTPVLKTLSLRPDVRFIEEEQAVKTLKYERMTTVAAAPDRSEVGLNAINAPAMWDLGYTGYGGIALILDTGTSPDHPALKNNYLGIYKPADQVWSGFGEVPYDCDDHGTHVAGTILGLDRTTNDTIGVAYNALWMASPPVGCGYQSTNLGIIETYQWALNPDDNINTSDDIPGVINNSWGFGEPSDGFECESIFTTTFMALEAAGIANVFAAGNEGPFPSTLSAPQNINLNLVNCFTTAAVSGSSVDLTVANFSSRGPSICGGEASLLIKPEVAAPGVSVRSSVNKGGYSNFSGTSMASPHVAGAVLLLREAFPQLTGETILTALYFSARDLGATGEDNVYGMGIIDVKAAYDYLINQDFSAAESGVAEDVLLIEVDVQSSFCADYFEADILIENGGRNDLTSFSVNYTFTGDQTISETVQWSGVLTPGERLVYELPAVAVPPGAYQLTVDAFQPNGSTDLRPLNNVLKLPVISVEEEPLEATVAQAANLCQDSRATLTGSMDNEGTYFWFDNATATQSIGSGSPWVTPPLSSDQTYWLGANVVAHTGVTNIAANSFIPSQVNNALVFDVFFPAVLKSVKVDMPEAGYLVIKAANKDGATLDQKIITDLPAGEQRIELNFELEPGSDNRLFTRLIGPSPLKATSNNNFPYEIPGILTIKGSDNGSNNYYGFFDWEVTYDFLCDRVPITVDIDEAQTGPFVDFTTSTDTAVVNQMISFTNNSAAGANWNWDFGDGNTSSDFAPTHQFQSLGDFNVVLTATTPEGCVSSFAKIVKVADQTTAIPENYPLANQIQAYPNPAASELLIHFELKESQPLSIAIIDILGRKVKTVPSARYHQEEIAINLGGLRNGIYYLSIGEEKAAYVKKIMVIR